MDRPQKTAKKSVRPGKSAAPAIRALPKGAIDQGETPEQTALREVNEETGVHADLVTKLIDVKYVYVRSWGDRARVFKIVSFYLLMYRSGRLGNISPDMRIEVQKAFWLPLENAPTVLSYKGERDVVKRALEYVGSHPELGNHASDTSR
jgi:8-oxo-dGTP pyrophosphatase MutT (NUDIX family)